MSYTQAPSLTEEEIEIFLKEARTLRICSLNKNGTIHAVPVWFKYENRQFIISTPEKSRRARNILRNPNVTLLIDSVNPPIRGVIVYGKGEVDFAEWELEELLILEKYMSKDVAEKTLPRLHELTKWVKVTIKTDRMASFDYEKDKKFEYAFHFVSSET